MQTRLSLMDEDKFWIYYLYIKNGAIDRSLFRLTDDKGNELEQLIAITQTYDLQRGIFRCNLLMSSGKTLTTRIVDLRCGI